ncbi:hypothetical protein [Candidatus Tisiphia endosymbiont of Oplodontha viridula]|uniref:hypothetical protein n=1 Tax=Candidatus Tisiphia endosymbiont of Oplodontha viridula TaxID=3077925 RepID=UPI0035C88AA1
MKTKRVNLPIHPKDLQKIDNYLTDIYNKKGLFTDLQKVYEKSRKAENSREYMTNPAIKEAIVEMQPDEAWSFFLYLAIGEKEAAYYLAASFINELGVKQNDDLASLAMAIGIKLGDKKSKQLAGGENFKDIKELTNQCVKQIEKNAKEVGKRDITYEEAVGRAKMLDNIVKTKLGSSFADNILPGSIKHYADFVAVEGIPYDVCGASTSAHNTSYDSGVVHDKSFESDIAMGGESPDHP